VVVAIGWRWPQSPIVLFCFAEDADEPWGIVKVGPDADREARMLELLGSAAEAAGARVPRLLADGHVGSKPALVETVLRGTPTASLLTHSPQRFGEVAEAVTDWLERWHGSTARPATVSPDLLERELFEPLAEIEARLPDAAAYRDWLAVRCAAVAGSEIQLVATHNDLTMWNVLLERQRAIGVLDWAEAADGGLPLTDFFYALVDAASACGGSASRLDALRSCFDAVGSRADAVATLRERLRGRLRLAPELVELAFHACWLRHARNELRATGSSEGPFQEIAAWLARRAGEGK
jgi:hypothetical protein